MNLWDIILGAALIAAVALAVVSRIRKKGKGCGCGCEGCDRGRCDRRQ